MRNNISKVSVLIPTYQPKDYVIKCFESIEKQTLSKDKYKVYMALNGSSIADKFYLEDVLSKFSFQRELFFLEQAGVSNARNFLIDNSIEEFVVFVDDDDMLSENYLEELLLVGDQDFMGVANSLNFENDLGNAHSNFLTVSFSKLKNRETKKFKSRKYFSTPWAKMLHRNMIKDIRFDPKVDIGEDSLFMAKISPHVKGVKKTISENACYYVNQRIGSATRKKLNKRKELRRVAYLLLKYSKMFLSRKYDTLFIATRIAATLKHHFVSGILLKLFK